MAVEPGDKRQRPVPTQQPALSHTHTTTLPRFRSRSEDEPDGSIVLGVAENKISSDVLYVSELAMQRHPPMAATLRRSWPASACGQGTGWP
jgi:hypothetical protein